MMVINDPDTSAMDGGCSEKYAQNSLGSPGKKYLDDFIEHCDQKAFEELVRLYGRMVYGVCRRVVHNHHDAEDAFQATFLILSQKAASIRNRQFLTSWLYQVAYQVSLRSKATVEMRQAKEQAMHDSQEPVTSAPTIWADLEPVLDLELNKLSEKYRTPVLLCDLGGSTRKEAAAELGWSQSTLSTRLTKARAILAERLARQGFALSAGALAVLISQNAASAAVPASLVASTLQTTGVLSVGQAVPGGIAFSKAVDLAQRTMKAMLYVHLKIAATCVLVLVAATVGIQTQLEQPADAPKLVAMAAPAQQTGQVEIPEVIRLALERNATELNPITISYTNQLESRFSDEETFERLHLTNSRFYKQLLQRHERRVLVQDQFFYASDKTMQYQQYSEEEGYQAVVEKREVCFNGSVFFQGGLPEQSILVQGHPVHGNLYKIPVSGAPFPPHSAFSSPYFDEGFVEVSFNASEERKEGMKAESFILRHLRRGGELVSVANTAIDGRPHVKIEIRVENVDKTWADQADVERMKQMYESNPIFSPEDRVRFMRNIDEKRKLPKTKRLVFFLDPELNYAARQKEEWYDPTTLLQRSTSSDFVQIQDRQLWLPRKCTIDYFSYTTTPGVVFEDSFFSEVYQVTELSGERISDSQFELNYTRPGVQVTEFPDELPQVNASLPRAMSVTYNVGNTPKETERNRKLALKNSAADTASQPETASSGGAIQNALSASNPKSSVHWFLIANCLVVLVIGGILAYRRFLA